LKKENKYVEGALEGFFKLCLHQQPFNSHLPLNTGIHLCESQSDRSAGGNARVEHSIEKEHDLDKEHPRQQRETYPRERWHLLQKNDTESQK